MREQENCRYQFSRGVLPDKNSWQNRLFCTFGCMILFQNHAVFFVIIECVFFSVVLALSASSRGGGWAKLQNSLFELTQFDVLNK